MAVLAAPVELLLDHSLAVVTYRKALLLPLQPFQALAAFALLAVSFLFVWEFQHAA